MGQQQKDVSMLRSSCQQVFDSNHVQTKYMMAILLICKWAYIAYLGKQFVKDHKEYFDTKCESCLDVLQGANIYKRLPKSSSATTFLPPTD